LENIEGIKEKFDEIAIFWLMTYENLENGKDDSKNGFLEKF